MIIIHDPSSISGNQVKHGYICHVDDNYKIYHYMDMYTAWKLHNLTSRITVTTIIEAIKHVNG